MPESTTNAVVSLLDSRNVLPVALPWLLFFVISLGLGYAALVRYDPRQTPGLSDSIIYTRLVSGDQILARDLRFRVLVPFVAKPFYWLAKTKLGPDKSALLALLIANSLFSATSASLLASIGVHILRDLATALLAASLYLLSFAIPNLHLAGMVDSGEACFVLAVAWSLLTGRWWLLPIWGLLGGLAKETFLPLASVFALAWWLLSNREEPRSRINILWVVSLIVVGVATITILRWLLSGQVLWPWQIEILNPEMGYLSRVSDSILSRNFWYLFAWLLPFGVWRLTQLPRTWVLASVTAAVAAVVLGAYKGVSANVARPVFDALGPVLSLSSALLITQHSKTVKANLQKEYNS